MMDLTPLDVRKKKEDFRRTVRGYDAAQVDSFLDLVAERLEQLVQSEIRLSEEVRGLRERLSAFEQREAALNEALLTAQELREEARTQAEKEAGLRVREAEQTAADVTQRAEQRVEEARRRLRELANQRRIFLRELRTTLERFMDEVEREEEALDSVSGDGKEDGTDDASAGEEAE